ncbi:MAG TPA: carboxypeptidase regulatory-like domain-containing protein [Gemmatimonadaceae bacterium]
MMKIRSLIGLAAVLALSLVPASLLSAQGVTTGSLTGTVTDEAGAPVEGAQVQLGNTLTGVNVGTVTRTGGLYRISGIEPNQNYKIVVRRIGYAPVTRTGVTIVLGEARRENFTLSTAAATLAGVTIVAQSSDAVITASKSGTTSAISDSSLRRLPTINRNFTDFVSLVPQISTTTGYLSGGGVNLRQNAIQIDGAASTDLFGLGTSGQPGSYGKQIPLDAVKEYQVMLSPFDVRQGNFGGVLINAVTRSGTNEWHGSLYTDGRSQNLTRPSAVNNPFKSRHGSLSVGGPIIKDKLFIFFSGEQQVLNNPASGSYIGASDQYVSQSSIDQVHVAAQKYGLADAGNGDALPRTNPNENYFLRLDANLPWNTRAVLRENYASSDYISFGRGFGTSPTPNFNLTSNKYAISNINKSTVLELMTNLPGGAYNEFLANRATIRDYRTVPVQFPAITIKGIARSDNPTQTLNMVFGTESSSQGNSLDQKVVELTDNFTVPVGKHSLTLGAKATYYRWINLFSNNSMGNWTFNSLDDFNNGKASSYIISAPAPTDPYKGLATVKSASYTAYLEDKWQMTPRALLTFGVRYDKPVFDNVPPLNPEVLADYKRATTSVPHLPQLSPRLGFNWDMTGDQKNQLRGGIGQFSGPPPYVYLSNAFGNSGLSGFGSLTCNGSTLSNTSTTSFGVPSFSSAAATNPPLSCLDGTRPNGTVAPGGSIAGPSASAAVATIDPNFKMPMYLKSTLGFDHRLKNGMVATIEGLWSSSINNAFYQNLALTTTPVATDAHGRQLYGILTASGATPTTSGPRTTVLDLTNAKGDYTWSITGQLQKSFTTNFDGSIAYTHQVSKDVVSVTSSTQGSNYRYQRDVSGRLDDKSVTRSKYDQPHRIVATMSYRTPWATDISLIYTGNSGAPYDYVYGNQGGTTGDLNGDGQTQNDLMYVPKNATNPTEILFQNYNSTDAVKKAAADTSAAAFERFISSTPCLNEARGTILKRNACRNPWVNEFDLSIAQNLGKLGFADLLHAPMLNNLLLRWDVINLGNLLNPDWGWQQFSSQGSTCGQICSATVAIVHTGNALPAGVTTNSPLAIPIVTFLPTFKAYDHNNLSSSYRMQLSVRYSF